MKRFYSDYIGKGDLCFDIGANIGERTKIFRSLGSNVIAIEPQEKCINVLKQKFDDVAQVTVVRCAVGRDNYEANLMICDETDECATLSNDFVTAYSEISGFHWNQEEKIAVKTLEQLFSEFGVPTLCKIDVEGFESEVLLGMKSPVKYVFFEFNKPLMEDTIKSLEILSGIGNYECNFIQYEHMKPVLSQWMNLADFKDQLKEIISSEILTGEILARRIDHL